MQMQSSQSTPRPKPTWALPTHHNCEIHTGTPLCQARTNNKRLTCCCNIRCCKVLEHYSSCRPMEVTSCPISQLRSWRCVSQLPQCSVHVLCTQRATHINWQPMHGVSPYSIMPTPPCGLLHFTSQRIVVQNASTCCSKQHAAAAVDEYMLLLLLRHTDMAPGSSCCELLLLLQLCCVVRLARQAAGDDGGKLTTQCCSELCHPHKAQPTSQLGCKAKAHLLTQLLGR